MMKDYQVEKLVSWSRVLTGEVNNITYRLADHVEPPQLFYSDLADSLDYLVQRIRRELRDKQQEKRKI